MYLLGLSARLVEPNRASWLIWGSATAIEAITYTAVNPGTPQSIVFLVSAAASLAVALALWKRSRWSRPDAVEGVCMAAALGAVLLWLVFREAYWAHMLVVAAVPVSFWPTWRSVSADPARERSPAWGLWTIGDAATLVLATRTGSQDFGEYAYILVELACHGSVWAMVGLRSIDPRGAFAWVGGRPRVVPESPFTIGTTQLGKAVFARTGFAEGETIVRFSGRRVPATRLPRRLLGGRDRFLQVDEGQYMGPSGAVDDLINHSCDPNAGLRFLADGVYLIAIRDIAAGEEIAWDYSTTLSDAAWTMACRCGAPNCRGTVAAFATLPAARQDWYRARSLVAPYLQPRPREGRPGNVA